MCDYLGMLGWEVQVEICSVVFFVLAGLAGLWGSGCCVQCVVSAAIRYVVTLCVVGG
jgi:hypothetical protein